MIILRSQSLRDNKISMLLQTAEQLRAARAYLGWTQQELAERAGVSTPTVKRLERMSGPLKVRLETVQALHNTFREAGLDFVTNGMLSAKVAMEMVDDADIIKFQHWLKMSRDLSDKSGSVRVIVTSDEMFEQLSAQQIDKIQDITN